MSHKDQDVPLFSELSAENALARFKMSVNTRLNAFQVLPTEQLSLSILEVLTPGTYRLSQRPSVSLLQQFPEFKRGNAEIGIACLDGNWIMAVGDTDTLRVSWDNSVSVFERHHLFQTQMHSQPGSDQRAFQPSDPDLLSLKDTINGVEYLITRAGLITYHMPDRLPGGFTSLNNLTASWEHWILKDLQLNERKFNKRGGDSWRQEFLEKFFGLRTIPWDSVDEIDQLLASKELLQPLDRNLQNSTFSRVLNRKPVFPRDNEE